MKRSPMPRQQFHVADPVRQRELRLEERSRKMANMAEIVRGAPVAAMAVVARFTDSVTPVPKNPADRNQAVRDLAMGEECQVRYRPVCRGPGVTEYTVWAHPNTQAENKGGAYKGNDSGGVFACDRCHWAIDFDRKVLPAIHLEEIWRAARERTVIRLRFIANSLTERAWRVKAARWVIGQLEHKAKS